MVQFGYRVIRNDSGKLLLLIFSLHVRGTHVGASVGSATSTRLAAVRSPSRCKNGKCCLMESLVSVEVRQRSKCVPGTHFG